MASEMKSHAGIYRRVLSARKRRNAIINNCENFVCTFRNATKLAYRDVDITKKRNVTVCCAGYWRDSKENTCKAINMSTVYIIIAVSIVVVAAVLAFGVYYRRKYMREADPKYPSVVYVTMRQCFNSILTLFRFTPGVPQTGDFDKTEFNNPMYNEQSRVSMPVPPMGYMNGKMGNGKVPYETVPDDIEGAK